jgi:hypothetical protein
MTEKIPRQSQVEYSKASENSRLGSAPRAVMGPALPQPAAKTPRSAQMDAVVRLMTGQTERTIAEKFADSNRPTWEQYKKDNSDKLNLDGMDEKKMEEYRQQLDSERDRLLARASGHDHAKKPKKRKNINNSDDADAEANDDSSGSDNSSRDHRRRRKHRKKSKKKKKKYSRKDDDSASNVSDRKRKRMTSRG